MEITPSILRRLPKYLQYLKQLPPEVKSVSATTIASALDCGDVQVRKDLSMVSGAGKPKTGYNVANLTSAVEHALGCDHKKTAIIVGAGKLGSALLDYTGFSDYGLDIIAGFDNDPEKTGSTVAGKPVLLITEMSRYCEIARPKIGIITTPASEAQLACGTLADCGIVAIWNFAQIHISAPPGILVHNENMAFSLALLSSHLSE